MSHKWRPNVPEDFFKAEYRNGYYVSEKMKKIWAVELDLLVAFVDVCEKNKLGYFLDGGTLLGAVRHKGFIPWDDDVDVIMPREDYDKLFEIASSEFKYPYFFQTTLSEEGFFRTHAQLRNSETTGFIDMDGGKKGINKGIFIDIFPLDGLPDSQWQYWLFKKQVWLEKRILGYRYDKDYSKLPVKKKLFYIFVHAFFKVYPFKKFFQHFNLGLLSRYSKKNTKLAGDLTLKWRKSVQWPREWFSGYVYLPFEYLEFRAPLFYLEVLERQYGNFMKFPKDFGTISPNNHGTITFEPDIPYKEYCKETNNTDQRPS